MKKQSCLGIEILSCSLYNADYSFFNLSVAEIQWLVNKSRSLLRIVFLNGKFVRLEICYIALIERNV